MNTLISPRSDLTSPLRILVACDESSSRQTIRETLTQEDHSVSITEVENGVKAISAIRREKPHVIFLDVQLPDISGFEVIKTIGVRRMPSVTFVTTYDQSLQETLEGYRIGYVVKPIDDKQCRNALKRARTRLSVNGSMGDSLQAIVDKFGRQKHVSRILVRNGERLCLVPTEEVFYVSANEKYVFLHTNEKKHMIRASMKEMESKLDPSRFARIHRSSIVNIQLIKELEPRSHGDYFAIMKNGTKLVVSRRYAKRLFTAF